MKKGIRVLLIVITLMISGTTVQGESARQVSGYLEKTASYLMSHNPNPSMGSVGGDWLIMGLARSGKLRNAYGLTYEKNLAQVVEDCKGNLSERKYTEYSRVVIALTSINRNPKNFRGYNLLKPLAELDGVKRQGANGIVYALIALDCGNYEIPEPDDNYHGEVTTREKLLELILAAELQDGGWAFSGKKADADMTAMTIQALAPYYKKNDGVKKAVNKGLECLSEIQLSDGSFQTGPTKTCESTAQVLTALSEIGISINDKRFVKNGKTVFDGLLTYYRNGSFAHLPGGDPNEMATEQAFYAMVAYERKLSGKNRFYEMSDAIRLEEQMDSSNKPVNPKKESAGKITKKKSEKTQKKTKSRSEEIVTTVTITEETTKTEHPKKEATSKNEKGISSEVVETKAYTETETTQQETTHLTEKERKNEAEEKSNVPVIVLIVLGVAFVLMKKRTSN